jgi:hypothetical protein
MSTRKNFLASGAALAALAPVAATASPAAAPKPSPSASPAAAGDDIPELKFSLAAFDAALATPSIHKHLFTTVKIDSGEVFGAMRGTLDAYAGMGVALSAVRPVAVLYHGIAIALGFDDLVWNEYFLPFSAGKMTSPQGVERAADFATVVDSKTKGNPVLHKTGGDYDMSIESLVADANAHFFLCNNATRGFASIMAKKLDKHPADVYATMSAHLVPNAMLVPAGVWAVHAVQERRYTLLQTSL